jgi:hypothetical protein
LHLHLPTQAGGDAVALHGKVIAQVQAQLHLGGRKGAACRGRSVPVRGIVRTVHHHVAAQAGGVRVRQQQGGAVRAQLALQAHLALGQGGAHLAGHAGLAVRAGQYLQGVGLGVQVHGQALAGDPGDMALGLQAPAIAWWRCAIAAVAGDVGAAAGAAVQL